MKTLFFLVRRSEVFEVTSPCRDDKTKVSNEYGLSEC